MNARQNRIIISAFIILLAWLVADTFPAGAQTISGVIAGRVRDAQEKPIEGASVSIKNPLTGRERTTSTDSNGEFRFPEVQPGEYTVTIEKELLKSVVRERVVVSVNRQAFEDVIMRPADAEPVVVEVSSSPMTDRTGPTISLYFPSRQVQELPLLTRDVNNLALLSPGILSVRSFSFSSTLVPFSVNGSRGRDNNFIIDSVDNNEPLFGGAATQFSNTDIFAEYTILTNQLKAEFGRNSGATINVITKSGSNEVHGSLFWYGQHDALNSLSQVEQNALLTSPSRYYENQIGATVGGPLRKEKTFYFLSYQWNRATANLSNVFPVVATLPTTTGLTALRGLPRTPALNNLLSVPTVVNLPGFSAPCFSAIPPPPATGFNLTNPCRAASNALVGTTNVAYSTFLVPNSNVFSVQDHQLSARFDHRINNDNDFYGRYLYDDITVPRYPLSTAGDAAFSDLGLLPDWQLFTRQRSQSLLLNHRRYWRRALNEFRFAFSRVSQGQGPFRAPQTLRNVPAASVTDPSFGGFNVYQANFLSAGQRFALGRDSSPAQTDSNVFQFQENFSFSRRGHNFKLGMNFVRIQSNIVNMPADLGIYFYEPFFQGGLESFVTETGAGLTNATVAIQRLANIRSDPNTGNITGQGPANLSLREFDQFYFFQDDWQVTPTFTFSWGLRYENFGQPINRIRELNPRGPSVERDDNNFGPRIGFAWAPWNRLVFRGGYALMYNPVVLSIPLLIWQSAPISPLAVGIGPGIGLGGPQIVGSYPNSPFTAASINRRVGSCSFPIGPLGSPNGRFIPGTVPYLDCAAQDTVGSKLVNPYVHNFSLGYQLEMTSSLLWELSYVGSKGTKLFLRENRNPYRGWNRGNVGGTCPAFSPALAGLGCQLPRVNPNRGQIAVITNGGSSSYHSLQTSLTRRMRSFAKLGDIAFTAAYTWSHNIDNASEILGPGVRVVSTVSGTSINNSPLLVAVTGVGGFESIEAITPFAQNPNNLWAERGNSAFDRRHRFAFSYVWDLAPRVKNAYLRGWQWSGVVSYQSGQPFSPLNSAPLSNCADYNGDGLATNDRPSIGNPKAPIGSVALLADPNCIDTSLGYVDLTGLPIAPSNARFVQVPVGVPVGSSFTVGSSTFVAGNAGRNILVGPNSWSWDMSVLKNFYFRHNEKRYIQVRWEVYNLFDRRNPGNPLGNVFTADAQASPAYSYSPSITAARATGVIPENALDAFNFATNEFTFLSTSGMNTSTRRMQFALRFIF
jgi:hypothetical protein